MYFYLDFKNKNGSLANIQKLMKKSNTYRILSYNLFMRPPPIKTNEDDFKNQRLQDILDSVINEYDILCFQELFQTANFRAERMIETAIAKGFYYWVISEPPAFWDGPATDSGLLVMSKYPIVASKFQSFKLGVLSDTTSDKAYIYCKININGDILHLFSTHLQASYLGGSEEEYTYSVLTRLTQLRMLRDRMIELLDRNKYKDKDLVMLAGDMNMDSRQLMTIVHDLKLFHIFKKDSSKQVSKEKLIEGVEKEISMHAEEIEASEHFKQYMLAQKIFRQKNMHLIDLLIGQYRGEPETYTLKNSHDLHPITYGLDDKVLTGDEEQGSQQRLDYIFQVAFQSSHSTLHPAKHSCVVKQFKIIDRKYTQLSDHFAVSVDIEKN